MNALVPIRLADIVAHPMLGDAELLGTQRHRSSPVVAVDLARPSQAMECPLSARGVVVLALDAVDARWQRGHLVDVLLRRTAQAGSAALIIVGVGGVLAETTRNLAEHLRVPVIVAGSHTDSIELVIALRALVATPQQPLADLLLALARRLRRVPQRLDEVIRLLESELPGANVYACAGAEMPLVGTPKLADPAEVVALRGPSELLGDGYVAAVQPVEGLSGENALWLVVERENVGHRWAEVAGAALALCSGAVVAWLAREQAASERDARHRSAVLSEIIESGAAISAAVKEQAAGLSWPLEGWHTGLHLRLDTGVSTIAVRGLLERLVGLGVRTESWVERADGWVAWVTTAHEPGPDHARHLARQAEAALASGLVREQVALGLGSPHRDAAGISATLSEARQAAVIAATSAQAVAVRVLQEVGPSRLLLGWYSSEAFADYARDLLAPLVDGDEPELLRTLEAYLERACSIAQTARFLGVHRNTVAQRIARAERLLGCSAASADTRLALQLALRVIRTASD